MAFAFYTWLALLFAVGSYSYLRQAFDVESAATYAICIGIVWPISLAVLVLALVAAGLMYMAEKIMEGLR